MKRSWKSLAKQFNQLKLSERRLVVITSFVVVMSTFTVLVWQPLMKSWGERSQTLQRIEGQISALDQSIETLIYESEHDPNEKFRAQLNALTDQVKAQQQEIYTITSALITPEKMNQVFEKMLSNRKLKLISIENAKAIGVKVPGQSGETALLYEHGLRLEMEGSYTAVLKYIEHLESQNWKLYWDQLIYKTSEYPNGILHLDIHTLSTSEHVLGF